MTSPEIPRSAYRRGAVGDAIALTFDDGPCLTATPEILELLKKEGVRATFFMVGEHVRRHPDLAMRAFLEGHQIANHSDRHRAVRSLVPSVCLTEAAKAGETFRSVLGVAPSYYRPPKGLIHGRVVRALSGAGYAVVTWSRMPGDYFRWHTPARITKRLVKAEPGDIVVLHDGLSLKVNPDRTRTLGILPGFIRDMKKRGFRFVTVAELLGLPPYFPEASERSPR